jgi:hypothetical protein
LGHGAKNSFSGGMGEASFFEVGRWWESMGGQVEEEDGALEEAVKEIESWERNPMCPVHEKVREAISGN